MAEMESSAVAAPAAENDVDVVVIGAGFASTLRPMKAFVCLVMVLSIAVSCRNGHGTPSTSSQPSLLDPSVVAEYRAIAAGIEPVQPQTPSVVRILATNEFNSIASAEDVAGFHIPVPAPEFPMGFGLTYLRVTPSGAILSSTQYTYPPLVPQSIGVDAGPAAAFNTSDFASAPTVTVGDKTGYLLERDSTAFQFAYDCGDPGRDFWCVVQSPSEVSFDEFSRFVSTIR